MVAVTILLSKYTVLQLVVIIQPVARRWTANVYTITIALLKLSWWVQIDLAVQFPD